VRRAAGIRALKEIRSIVDQDLGEEAARAKLLHIFLRYGWMLLLLAAGLLGFYFGVF
jgi:hypothetical protein